MITGMDWYGYGIGILHALMILFWVSLLISKVVNTGKSLTLAVSQAGSRLGAGCAHGSASCRLAVPGWARLRRLRGYEQLVVGDVVSHCWWRPRRRMTTTDDDHYLAAHMPPPPPAPRSAHLELPYYPFQLPTRREGQPVRMERHKHSCGTPPYHHNILPLYDELPRRCRIGATKRRP